MVTLRGRKTKRRLKILFWALLLFLLLPGLSARAEDAADGIFERSGAGELYDGLDGGTKELLSAAGVEDGRAGEGFDGQALMQSFSRLLRDKLSGPVKALAALLAVILLTRLLACFDGGAASKAGVLAGALACAAVAVLPLLELVRTAEGVVEGASVFLLAAAPVYGALLAVSGGGAAGASYGFLTLAAGNVIPILSSSLIFPLLHVFLALALVCAVSEAKFDRLAQSLYGFGKWLLTLSVTVFSGVLSIQTVVSAQADAVAGKAGKLVVSAAVPIVGGALGDAVGVLQSSVQAVKSGVGAFGILAALCMFAPAAAEAVLWAAVCGLGQLAADLFDAPKIASFLGMCASCAKMILAVIASVCAVCVVSAAVLLFVKGAL